MRVAGLLVGCAAAVAATAVVFLSDDPQVLRVAVVAVAWACLGAAFAAGRRPEPEPEPELQVREAEAAVRRELEGLRSELAGLRRDLTGLDALRTEVAAVGALRADLAELAGLRGDLAELAGLRADVGRLRAELTERHAGEVHHAGEMHVERVVMRTQSVRGGREPLEPATAAAWHAGVTRELGGWPGTPEAPAVVTPATVAVPVVSPEPEPVARVLTPPPVPVDAGAPRRRRTDLPPPVEQLTVERPTVHAAAAGHGGYAAPLPQDDEDAGAARLAEILAESGVTPGGRRRRYREER